MPQRATLDAPAVPRSTVSGRRSPRVRPRTLDLRPLVAAALLALGPAARAQRDVSDVQVTATHLAGGVHMLTGAGGNIGVSVGADGILIVDDQFAPLADKIRAALGQIGKGKLRFVLNTHYHADHTGGNPVFGPEAPIIAHDNVRSRLAAQPEPMPPAGLPLITFDHSLSVHFNGEEIRLQHFPGGHTDGDSVVYFSGSNVVHMGDDFFSGTFPFIDLDAGGSVQGVIRAVEAVLDRLPAGAKIIPGHGPLSDAGGLRDYLGMLRETSTIVGERMQAGKSLAEIQQEGLPEKWKSWDWRFVPTARWLQIVHDSLAKESAPR
jgi:glyoxylase-like metal-dependent hydrolase (beta-lactamase superfamily II)